MGMTTTLADLKEKVGKEIGTSKWIVLSQDTIDAFADVTGDHQFIHVDPAAAAKTPFGGTIAHGFLTLSLLAAMADEALPAVSGRAMGVNYGFDKVRFVAPVRSGKRVRGRFTLVEVTERSPKEFALRYGVTVEIEGGAKPAIVADWLTLAYMA